MAFDLSLSPIKNSKNEYLKSQIFGKKEIAEFTGYHNLFKFPIGTTKDGKIYCIDLSEACRILMLGLTRSGKTWLLRVFLDRLYKTGLFKLFIATDIKDEFKSSYRRLQNKFKHLLLKGEKPCGIPIVTIRPTFFSTLQGKFKFLKEDNIWYSPNINDMSKADFLTLMRADELTENQRISMNIIYDKILERGGLRDVDEFDMIIDEIEDITPDQRRAMKYKFYLIKKDNFFNKKYNLDVVDMLAQNFVVANNLEGFEEYGTDGAPYPAVNVNILQNIVNKAQRTKMFGNNMRLFNIIDEASRFIPSDRNLCTVRTYSESVDIDARYGIYYLFATQTYDKLPEGIIKQCRYVFLPYSADLETIRRVLRDTGILEVSAYQANRMISIKKQMKKHEWIVVDRNKREFSIVKPLAPLSHHMETGE
ncbi:hypothetical protein KKG81_13265 [bacterium]|nr:hypothetical protein [bacterium]